MTPTREAIFSRAGSNDVLPMAVKIDNMLFSSTIPGRDPVTGELGEGVQQQLELAFSTLKDLVERAGLGAKNIAHVTVFTSDASARQWINEPWCKIFPDEGDRPARKTTTYPLPAGHLVQLQAVAVERSTRESLEIPGLTHRDPLPMGAKMGDIVYSSVIGGQDPKTNKRVEGVRAQTRQAMWNMRLLVEQAGGTVDDIGVVWIYLRDRADQPIVVDTWLEMFPHDGNRPARKTILYEDLRRRDTLLQLQFTAVLGSRRQNFEIPGVTHRDPIPMGARIGHMLFSSGIGGYDPVAGTLAGDLEAQSEFAFQNLRALAERADGSLSSIAHLTILLRDYGAAPTVMRKLCEAFPDTENRPACHAMVLGLPGANLVQLHATGVAEHR